MKESFETKVYNKLRGGNYAHYMKVRRDVEAAYKSLAYSTPFTQRWAVLMSRLKKLHGYIPPKQPSTQPATDRPSRACAIEAGITRSRFASKAAAEALYKDVIRYGVSGYPAIKRKYVALHQHYTGLSTFNIDWARLLRKVDATYNTNLSTANKRGLFL